MRIKHSRLVLNCAVLGTTALMALSGCSSYSAVDKAIETKGQFWQRVNASSSLYINGPKAQQLLKRDIARCVVELRELERLGAVRDAIPTDFKGRVLDPNQQAAQEELSEIDSPERDKHLYAEHADYSDFEGCMYANGWERIKYVPYDVAQKSRDDYIKAHIDYKFQSRYGDKKPVATQTEGEYGSMNN